MAQAVRCVPTLQESTPESRFRNQEAGQSQKGNEVSSRFARRGPVQLGTCQRECVPPALNRPLLRSPSRECPPEGDHSSDARADPILTHERRQRAVIDHELSPKTPHTHTRREERRWVGGWWCVVQEEEELQSGVPTAEFHRGLGLLLFQVLS